MMFAGAAPFVLPIGTEGLVVFAKEEFASELFHDGLVEAVPGGGCLAVNDSVGETPETYVQMGSAFPPAPD